MPISNLKNDTDEMPMHETLRGSCLRADWQEISLGELFKVKHGFAFKGEFFTEVPQNHVLVTPGNFAVGGGFQYTKFKFYNGAIPEDYILKSGQVVVTMTDLSKQADTLGFSGIIPKDNFIWLHNQRVGLLEFRGKVEVDPIFISYLLRTHEYRSWIIGSATGTTVKHTSPSRIESYKCRIPFIKEQREIANTLHTLDQKIELNRQTNQTLEQIAQAIFKSWFVDFEPTRAKIAAKAAGATAQEIEQAAMRAISGKTQQALNQLPQTTQQTLKATAKLFPETMEESELGEIPQGWEVKSLSDIAQYANGKIEVSKLNFNNYISTENMLENRGGVNSATSLPSVSTVPNFSPNHILISNIRPYFKKIWLARFDGGRSNDVLGFVAKEKGCEEFLYNLLYQDEFFEFMMRTSKGAKMPRGDKDAIASWKFVCASKTTRIYFSEVIKPYYSIIESLNSENTSLTNIRENLLPKLLSGELAISELSGEHT